MESFVQPRKAVPPKHLHADRGGLKDDELGRAGFTRPHREHVPPSRPHRLPPGKSARANHYYAGPNQREAPRPAVGAVIDCLTRHGVAGARA